MRIAQEEIFGPVIGILRASNFEDALAKANGVASGSCRQHRHQRPAKAFQLPTASKQALSRSSRPQVLHCFPLWRLQKFQRQHLQREQGQSAAEFIHAQREPIYVGHG